VRGSDPRGPRRRSRDRPPAVRRARAGGVLPERPRLRRLVPHLPLRRGGSSGRRASGPALSRGGPDPDGAWSVVRAAPGLGLLADMSERFPTARGAIMGLYSVFLAIGQIVGSLIGGYAAEWHGIDGLLVATMLLLLIALLPLAQLRRQEYLLDEEHPELAPQTAAQEAPPGAPA